MSLSQFTGAGGSNEAYDADDLLSVNDIIAIIQRHWKLIAICTVAGLMLGIIYIFFSSPRYTASTSILIDPRQQNVISDLLSESFSFKENLILDSQIEVIRSSKLLEKAAQRLDLYKKINARQKGMLDSLQEIFIEPDPKAEELERERARTAAFNGFKGGLSVERVKNTFVIDISYTSRDPQRAAHVANTVADVYLDDELEAQYEASQRTNEWLKVRLNKLREELTSAEREVEAYKEENNIIQTSNLNRISDQQLSELNSNLIVARAESAQAKARYEWIQSIIEKGDPNVASSDLLNNSVIVSLRGQYIDLSRHSAEILRNQGKNHEAYRNLQRQMADIQTLIMEEYKRIAESYKSEYEIARSKEAALQKELDAVKDTSMISRRNEIELRELQRRAESTRNLYTRMLDKFNEQAERQSVPIVQARIISYADVPLSPSWPNKSAIMAAALFLGLAAGIGLAFLWEQFDKFIWKAEELEAATRRTCLGMLPAVEFDAAKLGGLSKQWERKTGNVVELGTPAFNVEGFREVTKSLDKQTGITTEIMRNVQLAVQFDKSKKQMSGRAQVISFVSARPGEGKSITSCFLAKHLAKTGARVALVDCDFRRPSLTNWFMPNADKGFYELASKVGEESNESVVTGISSICHKTGSEKLYFIPAKGAGTSITNLNFVSSGQMNTLIGHLQQIFDVVLIDLPPIINIVDARVIADSVDNFIFLAHWGKTDADVVGKALSRAPEVHNKTAGALLTLVDTKKASRYGYYNYNYYYHRYG